MTDLLLILFLQMFGLQNAAEFNQSSSITHTNQSAFEAERFTIKKSQLGPIKLGMKIHEAERYLRDFTKIESEAFHFGYGGGAPCYLYTFENEPVLGLIPALKTDSLLVIVAIHPLLKTENGLSPNSTSGSLVKKQIASKVYLDQMNDWEVIQDTLNRFDFVFMTTKKNRIGAYEDMFDSESTILDENIKANWITIK